MPANFIKDRTDVSEWLIHFVRQRDELHDLPNDDQAECDPDLFGSTLELDASAFTVLQNIVRTGGLFPSHSFRRGKTTIYGGRPVVCFTEAPLYNFVRYVDSRRDVTRCTHYGVCVRKHELFKTGGRPVIYGLAQEQELIEDTPRRRILAAHILPATEQFRYVAYDPGRTQPLDWTHEREWRWTPVHPGHSLWHESAARLSEEPALPVFLPASEGGTFSSIGFLVRTREEANVLARLLLGFRDAKSNNWGNLFSPDVLNHSFVIPLDEAIPAGIQRIEDLIARFRITAQRERATEALKTTIAAAVATARTRAEQAAATFLTTAPRTRDGHIADVSGGAQVVTYDTTTAVTDALLALGLARPLTGEYYIVEAMPFLREEQALSYAEAAARAAADHLSQSLGQYFAVRSWWD